MISVIGTVGVPACYGGFESLVENLLPNKNIDVIYCSKNAYNTRVKEYKGSRLYYVNLDANGVQSVLYDAFCIMHSIFKTKNNLLILGVSGTIVLPIVRLFSNRRIIVNIDGLEWKRDKWGGLAKRFLKFSEKLAVIFSDRVIADNQAIADYVLQEYGKKSEVIAYGGDHAIRGNLSTVKESYSLALCRIEPENNVHIILDAFSKCKDRSLKFIGNWNKSEYGRKLKAQYAGFDNIELIDPIYDLDLLFKYRSKCRSYIHGHSAGGTNPSLVEMMFFDIPIVCFDCNYNRATTENKAVYFSDESSLYEFLISESDLNENYGFDLSEIAKRRYTWNKIKSQYSSLFD